MMVRLNRRDFLRNAAAPIVLGVSTYPMLTRGADSPERSDAESAADRLREMNELARRVTVSDAELHPEPIVRYDDQVRRIEDATLWVYVRRGVPMATLKVEIYRQGHALYGLVSLSSDSIIKAESSDGWNWAATKSGLDMKPLPDAPAAGSTPVARLVQLRALARRFSGYEVEHSEKGRFQMRLLSKPVYRYDDTQSHIQDGAIFGLANGTNPDLLVVIESRTSAATKAPAWHYGLARMGGAELVVELDNREVWHEGLAVPVPAVRPTYMNRKFPRQKRTR